MNDLIPSRALIDFLDQIERFKIVRDGVFDFEAKQRMIERARVHAVVEVSRAPQPVLWFPPHEALNEEIERAENALIEARAKEDSAPSERERLPHTIQRHRAELRFALFGFIRQQFENSRLQTLAVFAGLGGLIASAGAIILAMVRN